MDKDSINLVDEGIFEIAVGYSKEKKEVTANYVEVIIKGIGIDITHLIEELPLHQRNKIMHSIESEVETLVNEHLELDLQEH